MNNVLAAALTLAALTACGAPVDPVMGGDVGNLQTRWVQGIGIITEPDAPYWANHDDETLNALRLGAEYAGGQLSDLEGWTIVIRAQSVTEVACNAPDHFSGYIGCEHDSGWIDIVTAGAASIYQTALIHEAVHAVLLPGPSHGDHCHQLPIWRDFSSVEGDLPQGVDAYTWDWTSDPTC